MGLFCNSVQRAPLYSHKPSFSAKVPSVHLPNLVDCEVEKSVNCCHVRPTVRTSRIAIVAVCHLCDIHRIILMSCLEARAISRIFICSFRTRVDSIAAMINVTEEDYYNAFLLSRIANLPYRKPIETTRSLSGFVRCSTHTIAPTIFSFPTQRSSSLVIPENASPAPIVETGFVLNSSILLTRPF